MKMIVIDQNGDKTKDITLSDTIWNIEPNDQVVKKMIRLQRDASRQGTHKTKTRSEVSGGGRKPWRQKGTGRARQGSTRAAQWRGGGVVFGVTPRDYSFKINKKERALALKSALSMKAQDKELVIVDNLNLSDNKTKTIKDLISKLNLTGKVLFVTNEDNDNLFLSIRNLPYAYNLNAKDLNVLDIINADKLVIEADVVSSLEEAFK